MYNPESQTDELIQNQHCSLKARVQGNEHGNAFPGTLSIQTADRREIYGTIAYNNVNNVLKPDFDEEDKLSGRDESYGTTAESRSEDSQDDPRESDLDLDELSQSGQNELLEEDFYKRDDGSMSSYQSPSGCNSKLFKKIQIEDIGADIAKMLENDTALPIANIGRLMKKVLPSSAKIAKQAKDMVRDCVTEFIFFVSSEASEMCNSEKRKTLNADDIFYAMNKLGFERYNRLLKMHHSRWRAHREHHMAVTNQRLR